MSSEGRDIDRIACELDEARRLVVALEAELSEAQGLCSPRQERQPLGADIEFIGDFDVVGARGIDLSDGGICFELDEALLFDMRFALSGSEHRHSAHLVWVRSLEDGRTRLGFKFVPADPEPRF